MRRSAALVFALAALVAAGAFALHVLSPAAPATGVVDGTDGATVAALRDLKQRIGRLEHEVFQPRLAPHDPSARLADLEERLRAVETSRRPTAPPARAPSEDTPAETSAPVDVRSLSDGDLLVQARSLARQQSKDVAMPFWREILERNPSDEVFVEANIEMGYAYRVAKDHEQEEEAFREALRVAGADTERGQWATYQIAWSQHFRGNHAAARDTMVGVASARATPRSLTGHARLYAARFSLELDDGERTREALQSILRDFGDSEVPMDAWLAAQATSMLARLK